MKEKINKILVSAGFLETEELIYTKTITKEGPRSVMVINGQPKEIPGQPIPIEYRVSVFIDNFWLDKDEKIIEPGFYLVQFSVKTPEGLQEGPYNMFCESELDNLNRILKEI